jgi:peptidoglycan/LPS O-acetylase OafA/YrhL
MTLRRWRIRFFAAQTVMMFGILIGASLFRDGYPGWIACAVAAVVGLTAMVLASIGWRRAEKQEAARLADAPPAPPDPRRWRVVEMRENDD